MASTREPATFDLFTEEELESTMKRSIAHCLAIQDMFRVWMKEGKSDSGVVCGTAKH